MNDIAAAAARIDTIAEQVEAHGGSVDFSRKILRRAATRTGTKRANLIASVHTDADRWEAAIRTWDSESQHA